MSEQIVIKPKKKVSIKLSKPKLLYVNGVNWFMPVDPNNFTWYRFRIVSKDYLQKNSKIDTRFISEKQYDISDATKLYALEPYEEESLNGKVPIPADKVRIVAVIAVTPYIGSSDSEIDKYKYRRVSPYYLGWVINAVRTEKFRVKNGLGLEFMYRLSQYLKHTVSHFADNTKIFLRTENPEVRNLLRRMEMSFAGLYPEGNSLPGYSIPVSGRSALLLETMSEETYIDSVKRYKEDISKIFSGAFQ